jgi:hypothetical protein
MTEATKPAPSGFSADTEILTRRGWLTFDELVYADEIATRSPEGCFEWRFPRRIIRRPHEGDMVWLHGRSLDALVTPGHPVLWVTDPREAWRTSAAGDLANRATWVGKRTPVGHFPATSTWDGQHMAEKVFPGVRRTKMGPKPRDVHMTGDQFAAFMGMYIAEGNVARSPNDWLVRISQMSYGKGYEEYRELLTAIFGHEPGRGGHQWSLHSRALYEYFEPLGHARDKWVPGEVLDLSRRQLEIFWFYYCLGDGSMERHDGRCADHQVANTASPVLAGQLQEVIQKLGYSTSVREWKSRKSWLVASENLIYYLRVRKTKCPEFKVATVPYSGMTGCVQVPNGVVYVRRNGRPAWCGAPDTSR